MDGASPESMSRFPARDRSGSRRERRVSRFRTRPCRAHRRAEDRPAHRAACRRTLAEHRPCALQPKTVSIGCVKDQRNRIEFFNRENEHENPGKTTGGYGHDRPRRNGGLGGEMGHAARLPGHELPFRRPRRLRQVRDRRHRRRSKSSRIRAVRCSRATNLARCSLRTGADRRTPDFGPCQRKPGLRRRLPSVPRDLLRGLDNLWKAAKPKW